MVAEFLGKEQPIRRCSLILTEEPQNLNRDPDWTAEGGTANPIELPLFTTDKVSLARGNRLRSLHMKRTQTVRSKTTAEEKTPPSTLQQRTRAQRGSYVVLPSTAHGPVHGEGLPVVTSAVLRPDAFQIWVWCLGLLPQKGNTAGREGRKTSTGVNTRLVEFGHGVFPLQRTPHTHKTLLPETQEHQGQSPPDSVVSNHLSSTLPRQSSGHLGQGLPAVSASSGVGDSAAQRSD